MARRAVWRERKDEPCMASGWLLRACQVECLPLSVAFVLAVLVGALALGWSAWAVLLLPIIALHVRRPLREDDLAALATVPSPGPAFGCRVEIRRGDVLLGEDVGVLTFVGGWIHWMGERTEFSLGPRDLRSSRMHLGTVLATSLIGPLLFEPSTWGLRLRGANVTLALLGDERVTFVPLAAWSATEMFEERDAVRTGFVRAFGYWLHAESAVEGESVLPPSAMHPLGMARAWRAFAASWGLLVVLMVALDRLWPHSSGVTGGLAASVLVPAFKRVGEARRLTRVGRRAIPARGTT